MNLNDKRKKVFSNKLESQSRPVVIGGVSNDEIKDLPTKEQILRERITEAEIKARRYLQQATEKAEAEAEAALAVCVAPCKIRYGWQTACRNRVKRSKRCA